MTRTCPTVYDRGRVKNPVLGTVIIVIILAGISLALFNYYLLVNNRGVQLHLGNLNILRLGAPEVSFPKEFEQSFTVVNKALPYLRTPRFVRNVVFLSENDGDITAKDLETGEQSKFSWNDNTHYICVSPAGLTYPGASTSAQLLQTLKNYVFFNNGNVINGLGAPDVGYYMFKRDIGINAPVKFILENEMLNTDGGYNILQAVVFTGHDTCVSPKDVTSDFPTQ